LSTDASQPTTETLALVAQAAGGCRRADEALIVLYRQRIARFVIAQTREEGSYEDLCQTIFVKMVLGLPRLREHERFEPWLFQIARNVCRDHLRAKLGWRRLFVPYRDEHDAAAAPPDMQPDVSKSMLEHIERLPDAQRALLRLSLDGSRSYEEMAELTRSSVSAVKSRLHRARENLKTLMLAGDSE
jgi:RNA polymerase sigma factor (sigma-70 family)